eukprot:PITA_30921
MASLDCQWSLICLLLFLTAVASVTDVRDMNIDEFINFINPPAVHKFLNEHGDTILCVSYAHQISLQDLEQRSVGTRDDQKMKSGLNFPSYDVETNCPEGTVAIMETKRELVERAGSVGRFISKRKSVRPQEKNEATVDRQGYEHEYGVAQFIPTAPIHGASGGLNVWQPNVDTSDDGIFSLGQFWVLNDSEQLESMEIGWIVNPNTYGDSRTRFFTYWTADGYGKTGCWNLNCPGFVLAPGSPAYPGSPMASVSTYDGEQPVLDIKVSKANDSWNLYVNEQLLGWWPASLFKNLRSSSNRVDYGGEVCFSPGGSPGSQFTTTDMGSGHFPSEGFGRSAHIRDVQITDNNGQLIDIPGNATAGRPNCYNVSIEVDHQNGKHVYFGGPGGDNPSCVV